VAVRTHVAYGYNYIDMAIRRHKKLGGVRNGNRVLGLYVTVRSIGNWCTWPPKKKPNESSAVNGKKGPDSKNKIRDAT